MNLRKIGMMGFPLLGTDFASSQSIISAYFRKGLGRILHRRLIQDVTMGDVGIGYFIAWLINLLQNLALLVKNTLSTFQVVLSGDFRIYKSDLPTGKAETLRFFSRSVSAFANRWRSPFAWLTLSIVKGDAFLSGDGANSFPRGDWGLTGLLWANGVISYVKSPSCSDIVLSLRLAYRLVLDEGKDWDCTRIIENVE